VSKIFFSVSIYLKYILFKKQPLDISKPDISRELTLAILVIIANIIRAVNTAKWNIHILG